MMMSKNNYCEREKPKTLVRNQNDVLFSWKDVFPGFETSDYLIKLQIQNDFREWKTIYYGRNTQFKVENLAPCTCYNFRIKLENSDDWVYFKAATEDSGPFIYTMHMTRAVKLGKTHVIRKIAQCRPILLNIENKENKTPIVQAIETGNLNILQLLITLGSNVNIPLDFIKRTPLMIAIYKGQLQMASLLVDKVSGADATAADINNLNILHYAVDSNKTETVEFALKLGLDVNSKDNNGWTPLFRAAILNGSFEIFDLLICHGADENVIDLNGFSCDTHRRLNEMFLENRTKLNQKFNYEL